jgi:hypothetical protein
MRQRFPKLPGADHVLEVLTACGSGRPCPFVGRRRVMASTSSTSFAAVFMRSAVALSRHPLGEQQRASTTGNIQVEYVDGRKARLEP